MILTSNYLWNQTYAFTQTRTQNRTINRNNNGNRGREYSRRDLKHFRFRHPLFPSRSRANRAHLSSRQPDQEEEARASAVRRLASFSCEGVSARAATGCDQGRTNG